MAWLAKTFLAIAISVVFAVFIGYAVFTFYEPPRREWGQNECWKKFECDKIGMPEACLQNRSFEGKGPYPVNCAPTYDSVEFNRCNNDRQKCDDEFQKTTLRFKMMRNSFIVLVLIGLISVVVGIFLSRFEGIGSGFIGGGVLVIIWSLIYTAEYWLTLNKYMKLIALGIVLIVLVYFGYKRLDKVVNVKKVSLKK